MDIGSGHEKERGAEVARRGARRVAEKSKRVK